ncbi:MAG TPA: alpha/beta hydrolase-fold protein [Streptosporangiaceae bacterium]
MLEPQGTGFFLILIVAFGALLFWVAVSKQVVFRVFAACLAFIPAMAFGIAAVNKYYDYYPTWGAMLDDLSGSGGLPNYEQAGVGTGGGKKLQQDLNRDTNATEDAEVGTTFATMITGPKTHITRQVIIYLPPQYFQAAYKHYKFPAIELLHGSPGSPIAWIDVLDVEATYLGLLADGEAKPAVLVMPDTDGGERYSLQCLNNPGGIQDMTYIAKEVPEMVVRTIPRVQSPGRAWGVAGYSEGGYCAANIALNEPGNFGYAGVLSGYFYPLTSQVPEGNKANGKPVRVNVFAGNAALKLRNTPSEYILHVPPGDELPQFWMAAGSDDQGDVQAAEQFRQEVALRQLNVTLDLIPGGHTGKVWRAALEPMLLWMTPQLAEAAANADAAAAKHKTQHTPARATKSGKPAPGPTHSAPPARKPKS